MKLISSESVAMYSIFNDERACRERDGGAMKIKLSKRVVNHIVRRHPEVKAHIHEIAETVQNPDVIIKGMRGELKALKFYSALHIGPKYLVVIHREFREEKVIITAYFTSNVARVKGEIIWRK